MNSNIRNFFSTIWKGWIKLGHFLGLINSAIILTVFYFTVITPIGLFRKIIGKDDFGKIKNNDATFWQKRKSKEPHWALYTRQF